MAKKDKFGTERRDEAAKWTSKVIGLSDFAEEHTLRMPGSFEKGANPSDDSSDALVAHLKSEEK